MYLILSMAMRTSRSSKYRFLNLDICGFLALCGTGHLRIASSLPALQLNLTIPDIQCASPPQIKRISSPRFPATAHAQAPGKRQGPSREGFTPFMDALAFAV